MVKLRVSKNNRFGLLLFFIGILAVVAIVFVPEYLGNQIPLSPLPVETTQGQATPIPPSGQSADTDGKENSQTSVKDIIKIKNEIRGTISQICAGLFFFITAYLTWRSLQESDEANLTDRYTKAVDQMQNENPTVRIGGIYALQRIARDSEVDYQAVLEVLIAYIREHAIPNPPTATSPPIEDAKVTADVQAALKIFKQRLLHVEKENNYYPDLSKLHLQRADLSGYDLRNVILRESHLENAKFVGTSLKFANLDKAFLNRAELVSANLSQATLRKTDLANAILNQANLANAIFAEATLTNAQLNLAVLKKAKLDSANLENASLRGAYLEKASWNKANVSGADFTWALKFRKSDVLLARHCDRAIFREPSLWQKIMGLISHMISHR